MDENLEMTEATAADAVAIVEEALGEAFGAGVDIEQVAALESGGIGRARELVSAVQPLLQVRRFACANFTDGRVLLELDGAVHYLSAEQAQKLYVCMAGST